MELIREALDAMGIVSLALAGLRPTTSWRPWLHRAGHEGATVFVVSGDRDSFQTGDENVMVFIWARVLRSAPYDS